MFTAQILQTAIGQQLNMNLTQGDDASPLITVTNNSVPINLTGYVVKMTIDFGTESLVLSTTNSGITLTDAAAGEFTINMTSTVTAAWDAGEYPYDIWLESQTSPPVENQYATGTITVNASITSVP